LSADVCPRGANAKGKEKSTMAPGAPRVSYLQIAA
jgi:hypothetical protein